MSPDPTLDALDERGRAAGAAVRAAVADRAAPALDPDLVRVPFDDAAGGGGGDRRRIAAVVGVAATVALLVGAAVVLAGRSEPESTPADRIGADELARYVLGEVPEGFEPSAVVEPGPGDGPEIIVGSGEIAVYGPDAAQPAVAVGTIPQDAGGPPVVVDGLDPVDVGGRQAWDASPWFGPGAVVVEVDDDLVYVLGASAGADAVVTAAAAVVVEDGSASLPEGDLPDGWHLLDTVPARSLLGGTPLTGLDHAGSADRGGGVLYVRGGGAGSQPSGVGVIRVWSSLGGDLHVHLPAVASEDVEAVTVRGRPGVLAVNPEGDGGVEEWALRWEERPGEVVEVAVSDPTLGGDEVLALAEGLRRATEGDLEELRRAVLRQGLGQPGTTLVGEGAFSDGSPWVLVAVSVGGESSPDLRTTVSGDGDMGWGYDVGTGDSAAEVRDQQFGDRIGGGRGEGLAWVYGLVDGEVATVEVRDPQTGEVRGRAAVVGPVDQRGWVLELDGDRSSEVQVVALDADGAEYASIELSI